VPGMGRLLEVPLGRNLIWCSLDGETLR
jgi:hypothetical protein